MLAQLTIASYPHLKRKEDRNKLHKKLHKIAYPVEETTDNKAVTLKDLGKILASKN